VIKLSEEVLEKLDEKIDLSQLMFAIDDFNDLRSLTSDGREEMNQLHELLRSLLHHQQTPSKKDGDRIYELVDSIECILLSIRETATKISDIISPIQAIVLEEDDGCWEGDTDDDDDEDDSQEELEDEDDNI
jgi:hypothetical protein